MAKKNTRSIVKHRRMLLLGALLFGASSPAMAVETSWWGFAKGWFSSFFAPKQNTPVLQHFGVDKQGRKKGPADYRNKVMLLTFWASWCPTCRIELPQLALLAKSFPKERLELVPVNVYDSREKMDAFIKQSKLDVESLFDDTGSIVTSFGISSIPVVLLVDSSGKIVHRWRGEVVIGEVRQHVAALLEKDKGRAANA